MGPQEEVMAVELVNPPGLLAPMGYAHVGVATGSRTVYIRGRLLGPPMGRPLRRVIWPVRSNRPTPT